MPRGAEAPHIVLSTKCQGPWFELSRDIKAKFIEAGYTCYNPNTDNANSPRGNQAPRNSRKSRAPFNEEPENDSWWFAFNEELEKVESTKGFVCQILDHYRVEDGQFAYCSRSSDMQRAEEKQSRWIVPRIALGVSVETEGVFNMLHHALPVVERERQRQWTQGISSMVVLACAVGEDEWGIFHPVAVDARNKPNSRAVSAPVSPPVSSVGCGAHPIENFNSEKASLHSRSARTRSLNIAPVPEASFDLSLYKRLYTDSEAAEFQHEFFNNVLNFLVAYAAMVGDTKENARQLFKVLQTEAFNCSEWDALLGQIGKIAIVLWTSASKVGLGKEFCSILNTVIRQDHGEALAPAVAICRTMAKLIVSRCKKDTSHSTWPSNFTYRGTSMPASAVDFFVEGLTYRTGMFLATSFDEGKAYDFLRKTPDDRVPVLFTFVIHPVKKCNHALFIGTLSQMGGEEELLFMPYSAFKVLTVTRPDGIATWDDPVVIEIEVFPNNQKVAEDVAVAGWH